MVDVVHVLGSEAPPDSPVKANLQSSKSMLDNESLVDSLRVRKITVGSPMAAGARGVATGRERGKVSQGEEEQVIVAGAVQWDGHSTVHGDSSPNGSTAPTAPAAGREPSLDASPELHHDEWAQAEERYGPSTIPR